MPPEHKKHNKVNLIAIGPDYFRHFSFRIKCHLIISNQYRQSEAIAEVEFFQYQISFSIFSSIAMDINIWIQYWISIIWISIIGRQSEAITEVERNQNPFSNLLSDIFLKRMDISIWIFLKSLLAKGHTLYSCANSLF